MVYHRREIKHCKHNTFKKSLLVEEVVVHFDLGIGLEVVWHEHDGNLNMT